MVQRKANGLGCHCPRHLCRITHWRHCQSGRCSGEPGSGQKIAKYDELASTHIFDPVAIETEGTWNHWAVELVSEIGRRATLITGEPRESKFLFQQLSIALRRGKAVAFLNAFDSGKTPLQSYLA